MNAPRLKSFPLEILNMTFIYLSMNDMYSLLRTNKYWRELLKVHGCFGYIDVIKALIHEVV
jgi:hypothetical protein